MKNRITGINISKIEFKLLNTISPWLLNIPNTAIAKKIIWQFEKKLVIFSLFLNMDFVIWTKTNGITITINMEHPNS